MKSLEFPVNEEKANSNMSAFKDFQFYSLVDLDWQAGAENWMES